MQRFDGYSSGSGAVLNSKLGEDLLQMLVYCPRADVENLADIAVALAPRHPQQHVRLTRSQAQTMVKIKRLHSLDRLSQSEKILPGRTQPDISDAQLPEADGKEQFVARERACGFFARTIRNQRA